MRVLCSVGYICDSTLDIPNTRMFLHIFFSHFLLSSSSSLLLRRLSLGIINNNVHRRFLFSSFVPILQNFGRFSFHSLPISSSIWSALMSSTQKIWYSLRRCFFSWFFDIFLFFSLSGFCLSVLRLHSLGYHDKSSLKQHHTAVVCARKRQQILNSMSVHCMQSYRAISLQIQKRRGKCYRSHCHQNTSTLSLPLLFRTVSATSQLL